MTARAIEAALEAYVSLVDQIVFGYPHSIEVANIATSFAEYLRLPESEILNIQLASWLHDIGHLYAAVERNSFDMEPQNSKNIVNHPVVGADYLSRWPELSQVLSMIANHQERLDGKGYPRKASGDELGRNDQLLSLCDVFVALTNTNRVRSREPFSAQKAIEIVLGESGKRWDRKLVEDFVSFIEMTNT